MADEIIADTPHYTITRHVTANGYSDTLVWKPGFSDVTSVPLVVAEKGAPGGVATLDETGHILEEQIPDKYKKK